MQYKTIILELLQQKTQLHELLRKSRALLPVMDSCAVALKSRHEELVQQLSATKPDIGRNQIASAAMEIAVQEMESRLQAAFPPDNPKPLSLDDAMAFIQRLMSRA